jgi:hypothetical protein
MSLSKTLLALLLLVGLAVFGLIQWQHRSPQALPLERLANVGGAQASALAAAPTLSLAMPLANDPRQVAAPKSFATPASSADPALAARYEAALREIEVDGCNRNASFVVRLKGERRPHMVRDGDAVELANGLRVTLRLRGYPACQIVLYDGKTAIGEVAGF